MQPSAPKTGGARPHLLHVFPSFAVGGAQSRLVQLLRVFGERYRHTIVARNGCYDMAAQMPAGAPVEYRNAAVGRGPGRFGEIRRFVTAAKPDALITYNWGSVEWAMANRVFPLARHIHIEDGFGPEERDRQLRRRVWFRRLALGGAHTTVVLPSRTLLAIAMGQWRLRPASLRYLVNGIDCERFAVARKPRSPGGRVVVGTVASLRREKNLGRLIGAFAQARRERPGLDLQLLIVGDGPERHALEETARAVDCAENVRFAGATQTPETWLAQMDIFAMSSDTEQMPLGVLEAMASGLPVISTDVGDIAEMVAPKNRRFITKLADEDGLCRSILALADDPGLREELGRINRQKAVVEFDYRQMAENYAALFG